MIVIESYNIVRILLINRKKPIINNCANKIIKRIIEEGKIYGGGARTNACCELYPMTSKLK